MTEGLTMEYLEQRFDGAIPRRLKDIVIYGSALKADIAELEDLVTHYQDQKQRHAKSAHQWGIMANRGGHLRQSRLDVADRNRREARSSDVILTRLVEKLAKLKERLSK